MTPAQTRLLADLTAALPPRAIVTDAASIAPYEVDWRRRYHGRSPAMIEPATIQEMATAVRLAVRAGVPLVPQGGNSSMVGGATPPADGSAFIVSTRRLNRIRSIDAAAGLAVVEAGVVLQSFNDAALAVGRRFPLTLGARGTATIGGLVSTNAGGTQVLRFGTMRGLVGGLEAVLPDGSVLDDLAALRKDNRGYDLTELLVGAEGTLGIVTAATLRLVPAVAARGTAWLGLASPADALGVLRRMEAATDCVESFELLPAETLDAALAHLGAQRPLVGRHPWHVLVEATAADAADESPAALLERLLGPELARGTITDAAIAASEVQADAFWRLRDSLSDAERALGPATQHDIAVPVDAMPRFMIEAAANCETQFPGTRASGFGHLGDGNVHFHVRAPAGVDPDAWYADAAPTITRFVDDLVTDAGGTISAEHGIGQMKIDELERLGSPARLAMLRAVKAGIDPSGLFNPGKLVRLAPLPPAP